MLYNAFFILLSSLRMRTSSWSTLRLDFSPWPTLDQVLYIQRPTYSTVSRSRSEIYCGLGTNGSQFFITTVRILTFSLYLNNSDNILFLSGGNSLAGWSPRGVWRGEGGNERCQGDRDDGNRLWQAQESHRYQRLWWTLKRQRIHYTVAIQYVQYSFLNYRVTYKCLVMVRYAIRIQYSTVVLLHINDFLKK